MSFKRIVFFLIIIVSAIIINNFVHSIYNLWQKQNLITKAEHELKREQKKNDFLKKQLSYVTKPQFIEEEARDKLFLVKPGEKVIIIQKPDVLSASLSAKGQDFRPNYKKWLDLFF